MAPSEDDDLTWLYDPAREQGLRNQQIGREYEEQMQRHFEGMDYKVIRYPYGQIVDLEAERPDEILFIQVKNWKGRVSLDVRELVQYAAQEQRVHRRRIIPAMAYSSESLSQRVEAAVDRYGVRKYPVPYAPSFGIRMDDLNRLVRREIKDGVKGARGIFGSRQVKRKPKGR